MRIRNFYYDAWLSLCYLARLKKPPVVYDLRTLGVDATGFSRHAVQVVKDLASAGYEAYMVGGCVRDLLCGVQPKDYDIVTSASSQQIKRCFKRSRIIGKRFRLVHVSRGGELFEVNTFRASEMFWDPWLAFLTGNYRRSNNIYGNRNQDVWRRDFTVNALYLDVVRGQIIDYVGGVEDIKQGFIRFIGDANHRVQQDPVRLLRALRFKAKTGFAWGQDLDQAVRTHLELLNHQAKERLFLECQKLFLSGCAQSCFQILSRYGVLPYLIKGFPRRPSAVQQRWWLTLMATSDHISSRQRLRSSFFFSALFWPLLMKAWDKTRTFQLEGKCHKAYEKACRELMRSICLSLGLPRRLQDAIISIWYWQFIFKCCDRDAKPCERLDHWFSEAYALLRLRAKLDESLIDEALFWAEG